MTEKDKQLLFTDLCARLLHSVKAQYFDSEDGREKIDVIEGVDFSTKEPKFFIAQYGLRVEELKPYLRSMPSMTKEENQELGNISYSLKSGELFFAIWQINWLNAHHFDYRKLIEKGLALEAPEGMYKIE